VLLSTTLLSACSGPPEGVPEWYFQRAYKLAKAGEYEEAITTYTDAIEMNH